MEVFSKIQEDPTLETSREDDNETRSVLESPAWSTGVLSLSPQGIMNGRLLKLINTLSLNNL